MRNGNIGKEWSNFLCANGISEWLLHKVKFKNKSNPDYEIWDGSEFTVVRGQQWELRSTAEDHGQFYVVEAFYLLNMK